jgi:hypothetical protein
MSGPVTVVNNSVGKPNFTQRKNPDDPSTPWNETAETCNVTAGATAMAAAGWDLQKLNKGFHPRPSMDLLYFMRANPACQALYDKVDAKHVYPMNEWMPVLALAMREYAASKEIWLVYGIDRTVLHNNLWAGGTAVIHGEFTFTRADKSKVKSSHYQALIGYKCDLSGVFAWIVDDPWGDPTTEYTSQFGDDVVLSKEQVDKLIKPFGPAGKDAIIITKHDD